MGATALAVAVALATATVGALASPAAAAYGCQPTDIVVTNNLDGAGPPAGSLRAAFVTASAAAGPQTICVATTVTGPITLTTAGGGELTYNAATTPGLTVNGNGVAVHAAPGTDVLDNTTSGPLQLDDLTITGGDSLNPGGGVTSSGDTTLVNTTITGNTSGGRGGGIVVFGDVTITNSTITNNTGGFDGGGVCAFGTVHMTGSTISGNTAGGSGDGGGICAFGDMTVTNSTVTGNTSTGVGGGLDTNGALTLVYATVTQNTDTAGAANLGFQTLASFGSVIAHPLGGGTNCETTGTSDGFTFTDDTSCGFPAADTHPGADPLLGALAANGGPTLTELPLPGSPLVDAIAVSSCQADGAVGVARDQRGVTRPQGPGCDIGAVEATASSALTAAFTG
jgi:hypothetical protein